MATMQTFSFTTSELEENATQIKNIIIEYLYIRNLISEETKKDFTLNYAILVRKPSFFSRLWKRINNNKEEKHQYIIVKQVTMTEPEEKPQNDNDKKSKVIPISTKEDK